MGKSPGKWIKGLFGKKKGRELPRSASEKPGRVSSREPISPLVIHASLNPEPVPVTRIENENGEAAAKLPNEGVVLSSLQQSGDIPVVSDLNLPNDSEKMSLEQAVTVVQTSLRSCQARDSFQTLKGIIKLQSFIRGHLVRRQAVSTLFCVQGIVKFQAIARGHLVRQSNNGNEQYRKPSLVIKDAKCEESCEIRKHSLADSVHSSAFIRELLSSSPTPMPLHLQYTPGEPKAEWDWLNRWSISQVWSSNSKLKETEKTKPNRNRQRKPTANANHTKSEPEKIMRASKKIQNPTAEKPNNPEPDFEKPKKITRAPKKIQNPTAEKPNNPEPDFEKPKKPAKKISKPTNPKLLDQTTNALISVKPFEEEPEAAISGHVDKESSFPVEKDLRDDQISSESYKLSRRSSLPGKYDNGEESPQNSKRVVPSYMQTTKSSKAKVKSQVCPRFGIDGVDKNDLTRRYSLPFSVGGKMSSSPRLVQANGGGKIDRSLSSSRDINDKVIQPDWKR